MSVRSSKPASGQKVSPVVVVLAAVALLAFLAWRAWVAFAPPHAWPLPPPPTQDINFINQKAQEAQGDFNKLSPEDQAKVQKISHGFGPASIASAWREQQKQKQTP